MEWLLYLIIAVFAGSSRDILEKRILQNAHALEYLVVRSFYHLFFIIPLLFFIDFNIPTAGYWFILANSVLIAYGMIQFRKALKHLDISIVDPLMNINPLIVTILAFVLLGEIITSLQLVGILLIVAGTYVLEVDHETHGLLGPFKKLLKSKYSSMVIVAAAVLALANSFDRVVLTNYTSPLTYMVLILIGVDLIYVFYHGYKYQWNNVAEIFKTKPEIIWPTFMGLLMLFSFYKGMALAPAAGLAVAIFRLKSLVTTLEGGKLFHEQHLGKKSLACTIMTFGAILVVI